ncbi:MAG: hypothetical protein QXL94_00775 [Candidatus Parvarchaeum sp.]
MDSVVEYKPQPKEDGERYLKVQEVLNIPLVVSEMRVEERDGKRGKYKSLSIICDKGKVVTGAQVLVKEAENSIMQILKDGTKMRLKISAKTTANGTYYFFDRP